MTAPRRWRQTEQDRRSVAYATPLLAEQTALYVHAHGIRRAARLIAGPDWENFWMDAKAVTNQYQLAQQLRAAAAKARAAHGFVAFRTETGGYPWNGHPVAWKAKP